MKILLDENLPGKLKSFLGKHEVHTVTEMRWSGKTNGELLALLHSNDFDALITADKNLSFQVPLQKYRVSIILLKAPDNRLRTLKDLVPELLHALDFAKPGQVNEVSRR